MSPKNTLEKKLELIFGILIGFYFLAQLFNIPESIVLKVKEWQEPIVYGTIVSGFSGEIVNGMTGGSLKNRGTSIWGFRVSFAFILTMIFRYTFFD